MLFVFDLCVFFCVAIFVNLLHCQLVALPIVSLLSDDHICIDCLSNDGSFGVGLGLFVNRTRVLLRGGPHVH